MGVVFIPFATSADHTWTGKQTFSNAKTIFNATAYVSNVPHLTETQLDALGLAAGPSVMSEHSYRCIRENSPNFTGIAWGAPMPGPQAAATAGDILVTFRGDGYDGTGTEANHFEAGEIQVIASENWDATHHGAFLSFFAIPNGQTTLVECLRLYSDNVDTFARVDQGQLRINMDGVNRFRFNNAAGSGSSTVFALQDDTGTDKEIFGVATAANDIIQGTAIGDACIRAAQNLFLSAGGGTPSGKFDASAVAGDTRLLLWDVTAGTLVRVSRGAADSGGAGFRLLRIPN